MPSTKLYPEVAESLRFAGSMCLLHLAAIHRTSDWLSDLRAELMGLGLSVRMVDAKPESIAELVTSEAEGEIVWIEDLRGLLNKDWCVDRLQRMRPVLNEARRNGWRVLLVSTVPPDLYPALAGSSILMDARLVQGRPIDSESAAEYVRKLGVTAEEAVANVVRHSSGSRALLEAFASIELSEGSGNGKRAKALAAEKNIAGQTFDEIGPSLCMWLEHWIFESGREKVYDTDIATNYIVALRSAGVIAPADEDAFVMLPYVNRELWIAVLGEYLESVVEPPNHWAQLVGELFAFERELRCAIKRALVEAGTFESALIPHRERILELARRDSVPGAVDLSDVRSPLDWLTLSDLLTMAQEGAQSRSPSRMCGYGPEDWMRLAREIVPIRNRVAHMRLARQGDLDTVRRCRRLWNRVLNRHS